MSEQRRILEKIESGEIGVAEGARLLGSSDGGAAAAKGDHERPGWAGVVQQVVFWVGLAMRPFCSRAARVWCERDDIRGQGRTAER